MEEKRIFNVLKDLITRIKARLPEDNYETRVISWGSTNTWTCPKTGIVSLAIYPSVQTESYVYVRDTNTDTEVYAHYQTGHTGRYAGQFVAVKGHKYSVAARNIKTSTYKLTSPTGSGGYSKTSICKALVV